MSGQYVNQRHHKDISDIHVLVKHLSLVHKGHLHKPATNLPLLLPCPLLSALDVSPTADVRNDSEKGICILLQLSTIRRYTASSHGRLLPTLHCAIYRTANSQRGLTAPASIPISVNVRLKNTVHWYTPASF